MNRVLGLLLLFALPSLVRAHALGIQCDLKKDKVIVYVFYDDDSDAVAALVRIFDEGKRQIAEGKTDAKGEFVFQAPAPGAYTVNADTADGHKATAAFRVPATGAASDGRVDDGPGRQAFTRSPWLKVGIGVGVIGLLAIGFFIARFMGKK